MGMLALECRRNEVLFGNPGRAGQAPLGQEHAASRSLDKDPLLETIGVRPDPTFTMYQ